MWSRILQVSEELTARSCFPKTLLSIVPRAPPLIVFMHIREFGSYTDEAYTQWRTVLKISANDRVRMWTTGHGAQAKVQRHHQTPLLSLSENALDK